MKGVGLLICTMLLVVGLGVFYFCPVFEGGKKTMTACEARVQAIEKIFSGAE